MRLKWYVPTALPLYGLVIELRIKICREEMVEPTAFEVRVKKRQSLDRM